jgi:hypothetical protein
MRILKYSTSLLQALDDLGNYITSIITCDSYMLYPSNPHSKPKDKIWRLIKVDNHCDNYTIDLLKYYSIIMVRNEYKVGYVNKSLLG